MSLRNRWEFEKDEECVGETRGRVVSESEFKKEKVLEKVEKEFCAIEREGGVRKREQRIVRWRKRRTVRWRNGRWSEMEKEEKSEMEKQVE